MEVVISVFVPDLLIAYQGKSTDILAVQILGKKTNRGNLTVFVGGVIIYAFVGVAAAGIYCFFKFTVYFYTASLLCNGTQDVKKLTDRGYFAVTGHRV